MNRTPFQQTAFSHVEKYGDQRQNIGALSVYFSTSGSPKRCISGLLMKSSHYSVVAADCC